SCTTPSSGAASTTGSGTPSSTARTRSCGPACPAHRSAWPPTRPALYGAGAPGRGAAEAAGFVAHRRPMDLARLPGVAETIDWTQALVALGQEELEAGGGARAPGCGRRAPPNTE